MLIRHGYEITVGCAQPTPMTCLLSVRPERTGDLQSGEMRIGNPEIPSSLYFDLYGNTCRRFVAPAGDLTIWGDATIADSGLPDPVWQYAGEVPVANLPDECLIYLLGSRYCDTDKLSQSAWKRFEQTPPGWPRVQAICDFVQQHITFDYQKASATRSATEAYIEGVGVCRDYAHLAITFCRCMNIPARYVNGYLGDIGVPPAGPMDFSAWIEVYLDCGWATFDPRNNASRIGRIPVAYGRDAVDVPLIQSFGPHELKSFSVWTYDVADPAAAASF